MIDAIEFVVAVGVVSAIIFVLAIRAENKACGAGTVARRLL